MEEHYSVLITLQESLPECYSDDNLISLEQLVTRYQEILSQVSLTADPENATAYYRERVKAIEAELTDAKYGHSEKQRMASFIQAKELTAEGISALLYHLNQKIK